MPFSLQVKHYGAWSTFFNMTHFLWNAQQQPLQGNIQLYKSQRTTLAHEIFNVLSEPCGTVLSKRSFVLAFH